MKKLMAILASLVMLLGLTQITYANDYGDMVNNKTIMVKINSDLIDFKDSQGNVVEPQIINDRTMVPFRKIFNAFGVVDGDIAWDGETQTVIAKKDNITIELQIDNTIAKKTVDGITSEITLDSAPIIIDGRTLVPVRFIAESMNKKVAWDDLRKTVIIIDTEELINDLESSLSNYIAMTKSTAQMPELYKNVMNISGKINYTDKNHKENNNSLKIAGNISLQGNESAFALEMLLKFTGKGSIYDALKENKLTQIDLNAILAKDVLYVKSVLLDSQTNRKWVKVDLNEVASYEEIKAMMQQEQFSIRDLFEVEESAMTITTYDNMVVMAETMKDLLSNEHIKMTEKGSTQTFEFQLTMDDIEKLFQKLGVDVNFEGMKGKIVTNATAKDGVMQSTKTTLKFSMERDGEKFDVDITVDGKVSALKKWTVKEPSASDVIDSNEIE